MSTDNKEPTTPAEAKGALDKAKEKARAAAEGVKDLTKSLGKHDFKAEMRDAFAETKKDPSSLWKKPETLRPGKDLAVMGLCVGVLLLLLLLVTSSSILGILCFLLGLGVLLVSLLGLKTQGRPLAFGGLAVGALVLVLALVQTFGSSNSAADAASAPAADAVPAPAAKAASSPAEAVRMFCDAMLSGDHAALLAICTDPIVKEWRKGTPQEFADRSSELKEQGLTYTVGEVKVDGDVAIVKHTVSTREGTEYVNMKCLKVDGVWKVSDHTVVSPDEVIREVIESMVKACKKGDFEAFSKLVLPSDPDDMDGLKSFFEEAAAPVFSRDLDFGDISVEGDEASVRMKVKGEPGSDKLEFKKDNGTWKFVLPY